MWVEKCINTFRVTCPALRPGAGNPGGVHTFSPVGGWSARVPNPTGRGWFGFKTL